MKLIVPLLIAAHYMWTGNGAANDPRDWGDALNWEPQGVPGEADTVTINAPNTYGISAGNVRVRGLTLTGSTALSAGDITVVSSVAPDPPNVFAWAGGEIRCTIHLEARVNADFRPRNFLNGGTIDSAGAIVWAGGDFGGTGGAILINRGTFTATGQGIFTGGPSTFVNEGMLVKSDNLSALVFTGGWALETSGIVEVEEGIIDLRGYRQHKLEDGASFSGGRTRIVGNTLIQGTVEVDGAGILELGSPGTVTGTATFDGDGLFEWTGGTIGPGELDLRVASSIIGDEPRTNDGVLINLGELTITGGSTIAGTRGRIENAGSLDKLEETTVTIGVPLSNTGTVAIEEGALHVAGGYEQSAGTTELAGGTLASSGSGVRVEGGSIIGSGTIDGDLTLDSGALSPGFELEDTGAIKISGALIAGAGAKIIIELAGRTPASDFDRVVVDGAATLHGVLEVSTFDGYEPTTQDLLAIIDYANHEGELELRGDGVIAEYQPMQLVLKGTKGPPAMMMMMSEPIDEKSCGCSAARGGDPSSFFVLVVLIFSTSSAVRARASAGRRGSSRAR